MKYTFIDGNGNTYVMQNEKLSYTPMTAEMSSSSTYSGGESFIKDLERIEMIKIVDVMERAMWSTIDHSDKRTMGSGTIVKSLNDNKQRIYLSYKSSSLEEINNVFRAIRPNHEN